MTPDRAPTPATQTPAPTPAGSVAPNPDQPPPSSDPADPAALVAAIPKADRFINRDLSWLEFNRRVLAQSMDDRVPLLERVRFAAIYANNLDEFFMKRVGLLKRCIRTGGSTHSHDGMSPTDQLAACRAAIITQLDDLTRCYRDLLTPALASHGIRIRRHHELTNDERDRIDTWYRAQVFPVLTPLAIDPGHRFPFISNLSSSLGVLLGSPNDTERHFARVKIPSVLDAMVRLDDPGARRRKGSEFLLLEDIIAANLGDLFPGMEILSVLPFRVTRSAAVEVEDEEVEDLLEHVQEELRMRRFAEVVRLEVPRGASGPILEFMRDELAVEPDDIYEIDGPLDLTNLFTLANLDRPDLRYSPWSPVMPPAVADTEADLLSIIRERDILVHHPYESFRATTERFIAAAADDPDVLAIKLTLYRTSPDSPFVSSLIQAAERGKQVACLVELRARFDERRNVRYARELEAAGVHVAYGVVGLKTHCKCSIVVRREEGTLRTYAHIGTGNYHPRTAQLYSDLGLFTADPLITDDIVNLFNFLTGRSHHRDYHQIIVAPYCLRRFLNRLIDREIDHARAGRPCGIFAQMNALEDADITDRLYAASIAGVPITLSVRGFCCLRPGVAGLSQSIRVQSVIGRFLAHARFCHFVNGCDDPLGGDWFLGSADWMSRNFDTRVEVLVPVHDLTARQRLARLVEVLRHDQRSAWDILPDGSSIQRTPAPDADPESPQALGTFHTLMRDAQQSIAPH